MTAVHHRNLSVTESAERLNTRGYWDPKRFPAVSAFFNLRRDHRTAVIESGKTSFGAGVDKLAALCAAGYAR